MTRIRNRAFSLFCAAAVVLFCIAGVMFSARAEGGKGSLTLQCVKDDDIVSGMHWKIYRIGHRVEDDYVFEGQFEGYRATLGDETKPMTEWRTDIVAAAGETLKLKTIADKIPYRDDGYTDSSGFLTFSGLEDGLYLICGDVLEKGDVTYIPSALFFEMNGKENAELNVYPKIILRKVKIGTLDYSVKIVWNDEDEENNKSRDPVEIEIYCDDEKAGKVVLSESNDWTYSWDDDEGHNWFVYEKEVPEGHTVAYVSTQQQFIIVNTPDSPDNQEVPPPVTTTEPVVTTSADVNNNAVTTSADIDIGKAETERTTAESVSSQTKPPAAAVQTENKLPQTGQLWWPVIPLVCGGVVLIGAGIILSKKEDE